MVGSLAALVESLTRTQEQQPHRFTNPYLSLKGITFLRGLTDVNRQVK